MELLSLPCIVWHRLELIDEAMLRPGRLGKLLYVPLPDAPDRIAILKALVRLLSFKFTYNCFTASTLFDTYYICITRSLSAVCCSDSTHSGSEPLTSIHSPLSPAPIALQESLNRLEQRRHSRYRGGSQNRRYNWHFFLSSEARLHTLSVKDVPYIHYDF